MIEGAPWQTRPFDPGVAAALQGATDNARLILALRNNIALIIGNLGTYKVGESIMRKVTRAATIPEIVFVVALAIFVLP
jgi:hypothetical protein